MSLDTFTDAAGLSYRQYARTGKLMILRGSQNQSNANSYIVAHVIDKGGKEEFGTAFGPMSSPEALSRFQTELLKIHTASLKTCKDCRYCGPDRPEGMIRCDHMSWTHWDEEMRVFSPDFAPECDSFESKNLKLRTAEPTP